MPAAVHARSARAKDWAQPQRLAVFPDRRAHEPLLPAVFFGGPVSDRARA